MKWQTIITHKNGDPAGGGGNAIAYLYEMETTK